MVSAVAVELEKPIIGNIVACSVAAFLCIFLGLSPQPADPEDWWWRTYWVSEMWLFFGVVYVILGIVMLGNPAKATSTCDSLGDAINELLEKQEPGESALRMPTKEQEQHINSLLGYVRGLNRGKGMGFMIVRKRITSSFVIALLAKVAGTMSTFFPIFLAITRTDRGEDELVNSTCCAC